MGHELSAFGRMIQNGLGGRLADRRTAMRIETVTGSMLGIFVASIGRRDITLGGGRVLGDAQMVVCGVQVLGRGVRYRIRKRDGPAEHEHGG